MSGTDLLVPVPKARDVYAQVLAVAERQFKDYVNTTSGGDSRVLAEYVGARTHDYHGARATIDPDTGFVRERLMNLDETREHIEKLGGRYTSTTLDLGASEFATLQDGRIEQRVPQHFRAYVGSALVYEDCGVKVLTWREGPTRGQWFIETERHLGTRNCD